MVGIRFTGGNGPTVATPSAYSPGSAIGSIDGIDFSTGRGTLLLFASSRCRYCTDSMPFYRKLATIPTSENQWRFVVVGREPAEILQGYVQSHALTSVKIISIAPGVVRVRATPTLILVDTRGRVVREWRGQLQPRQEEEVIGAIRAMCAECFVQG